MLKAKAVGFHWRLPSLGHQQPMILVAIPNCCFNHPCWVLTVFTALLYLFKDFDMLESNATKCNTSWGPMILNHVLLTPCLTHSYTMFSCPTFKASNFLTPIYSKYQRFLHVPSFFPRNVPVVPKIPTNLPGVGDAETESSLGPRGFKLWPLAQFPRL